MTTGNQQLSLLLLSQHPRPVGSGLSLPLVSKTPEEAQEHFGWFTMFAGMDVPTSSARTRELLGWQPNGPGLIADMEAGYFS